VEDDLDIREAISTVLGVYGYDVECAGDGQEALKLLGKDPHFALILLDLMMPVMNGWQFREVQRVDPHLSNIPVVLVSADPTLRQSAQALGAVAYLRKPVELSALLGVIEQYR